MVERTADAKIRTTEWEDIQYKHGNRVGQYRDKEHIILAQKLVEAHQNGHLQAYDPVAEKVQDKDERGGYDKDPDAAAADDSEGSDAEDDFLAQYRAQRKAKLVEQVSANKLGRLRKIPGATYVAEVTEASANKTWVLAALIAEGKEECDRLLRNFDQVAALHPAVKFVYMVAKEAVAKFPDKQAPVTLIYCDGALVGQVAGIEGWGGARMAPETIVAALADRGIIKREVEDTPEDASAMSSKYYLKM